MSVPQDARTAGGTPTALARAASGALFAGVASLRGRRSLHPDGLAFAATFVVDQPRLRAARLFARRARRPALVRFSRGFGLPEPLPEIVSLAVKVPDAYGPGADQDILLAGTGERPGLRHVFLPARSHLHRAYSSVLPFRVGARTMLLGAAPRVAGGGEPEPDLEELDALAAAGRLAFALRVATPLGPWLDVARVEVGERLDPAAERALWFSSDHAGGGIAPVGLVNRLRGPAYAASARARPG